MKKRIILQALVIAALIMSSTFSASCNALNPKPDLIIESVTYDYKSFGSGDWQSSALVYTISVKNIGNAPAKGSVWVSYASGPSVPDGSGGQLLKYDTEPPIKPNEIYNGEVTPAIESGTITFVVNDINDSMINSPQPIPDIPGYPQNRIAPRLLIDESNYKNNAFTLEVKILFSSHLLKEHNVFVLEDVVAAF